MDYCKNCILPNTKPGVFLDENGLCNACRNINIKKTINWAERFKQLKKIVSKVKKNNI